MVPFEVYLGTNLYVLESKYFQFGDNSSSTVMKITCNTLYIHTYIIGHCNPSVRITAQLHNTLYFMEIPYISMLQSQQFSRQCVGLLNVNENFSSKTSSQQISSKNSESKLNETVSQKKSRWCSRQCVGLLDEKPGFESQARDQNKIQKVFLRRFPISRFLAKTLSVNKIAMKSFLNLSFGVDFKLQIPPLMYKINTHSINGVRNQVNYPD